MTLLPNLLDCCSVILATLFVFDHTLFLPFEDLMMDCEAWILYRIDVDDDLR